LLRDPGHAAELGRAARATAEQLYDWNVIGRDMIATYIRTLERPSSVG
jgi:hypothetical protein